MNDIKAVASIIKKHKRFLVSAHINPEGDSIGSQVALASLLRRLGKEVVIVNASPLPRNLEFMPGAKGIYKEMPNNFKFEVALILDCPSLDRVGDISRYIKEDKIVVNIDHHISNKYFGKYNWVETKISSVGEMIFKLFEAFKEKLTYDEAVAIYVAIMTDTGSFRYTNTSATTHRFISQLIDRGVKPYDIYSKIYETTTLEDIKLLAGSLETLKLSPDGQIAWLWITKEMLKKTKGTLEGTEGIINFARSIENVKIAAFFRETGTENKIKISFRSKGGADVNKLASFFEGGGHASASGCTVYGSKEEVEKKVLLKAKEMLLSEKTN